MSHQLHRERQKEIYDGVYRILTNDEHVLGLMTAGSLAREETDAFSDLDMVCFLRDEEMTGRQGLHEQILALAPALCHMWIYDRHALFLYENAVRLDLDFLKPSDLSTNSAFYADAVAVYDPDGKVAKSLPSIRASAVAEHPRWFEPGDSTMIDWFFWMFRQAACWAKRGAQGGLSSFEKLSNAVSSLSEVRTRLIEMRLWVHGTEDYLSNVDPECAVRIGKTYPHLSSDEIVHCTRLLLNEFQYICPLYCKRASTEYPRRKAQLIRGIIDDFDRLD